MSCYKSRLLTYPSETGYNSPLYSDSNETNRQILVIERHSLETAFIAKT